MSEHKKRVKVATTDDLRNALAAGYEADQIDIDHSQARAEGFEEGKKSTDESAIRVEAQKAERGRIAKLQALARKGFDAELKAAIDNGSTPEAFAMQLLEAANDRGITLEAIGRDAPPPIAHAAPPDEKPKSGARPWDQVLSAHAAVNKF